MVPVTQFRILVIEDDPAIRATIADQLELNDYQVSQAVDGLKGLAQARQERPDIIITDVHMPGLDGFGLIKELHADEQTRSIPVIMVSASVESERIRSGMDLGADDYLVKPFTEEQLLRSVQARLEKKALLNELDAFAHTVAHDLKNPISVLMMRTELLRRLWEQNGDAEKIKKRFEEITADAARLANIVDELLLLSGVRRERVVPKAVAMPEVVKDALDRVANLVQQKGATIEQPSEWPPAFGHPPWVAEIWVNYISNALKYGGTPPQVELGAESRDDCVRLWVLDNGEGLTEEQQARLFLPFSRMSDARAKGHGLGLSIVRRIAEKLGGRVGVESHPGEGSRFWFELPVSAPSELPPDSPTGAAA